MVDIRHRIGVNAPQERVHAMVSSAAGLARWWTEDVRGEPHVGGLLEFYFGRPQPAAVMEVTGLSADRVTWRCVEGPPEWVGTEISFELGSADGETTLLFTHGGWREPVPFMHHCSTKWAYFLLGLKSGLEGGHATPHPTDSKISNWG